MGPSGGAESAPPSVVGALAATGVTSLDALTGLDALVWGSSGAGVGLEVGGVRAVLACVGVFSGTEEDIAFSGIGNFSGPLYEESSFRSGATSHYLVQ